MIRTSKFLLAGFLLTGCATTQATKTEEPPKPAETTPAPTEAAPEPQPVAALTGTLKQPEPMHLVVLHDEKNPLVTFRLTFRAGSIDDPKGKEGLTALTAELLAQGGTQKLSSAELLDALFPMAAEVSVTTDKELTAFVGRVHKDNLDPFFEILGDMLLEPRLDPKEFERLRADAINAIKNELRGQDDETLGKVALDSLMYRAHPYGHFDGGTVKGLESITLDDVNAHWKQVFTQDRLIVGLAGNITPELKAKVQERLAALPAKGAALVTLPPPPETAGQALIIQKPTLSTAISMGFPYGLRRGHPDYFPVALALSFLGEHRQTNGVLFQELREKRGLNYGDYAYAENFVQEGWGTYPLTNIARSQQNFAIWIRPVENAHAMFATRGALFFLDRLIKDGMTPAQLDQTRGFLLGYTRLLEQTDSRRLGYAIDGLLYGTPDFLEEYREAIRGMTVDGVNAAVRRHLTPEKLRFAFVAPDGEALRKLLVDQPPSPITYPTPKPDAVKAEDVNIEKQPLPIDPAKIEVQDASRFMEQ